MAIGEKISAITDPRLAVSFGAAVNRAELAKGIFVANFQISRFARVFQILRLLSDRAISIEFIFRSRPHRPAKGDMMLQPASFTDDNFGTDDAIRTDDCFRAELCFWINDR